MFEIISTLENWRAQDKPASLATVVSTWGSSPRGVGAKMVINIDGDFAGSVSGGCVESSVIEEGENLLRTGEARLLRFGVSDEMALEVGLSCGGDIDIFVRKLDWSKVNILIDCWKKGVPVVNAVVIKGRHGLIGQEILVFSNGETIEDGAHSSLKVVGEIAKQVIISGFSSRETIHVDDKTEIEIFFDLISPPPNLVIVGGVHIAIPLVAFGNILGFRTVIIDPRRQFASFERFPQADLIINAWPKDALAEINLTPTTAVAVLTHDPKIDDKALEVFLTSSVFYIGVLGSNKTQKERRDHLREQGLSKLQVERLKGPIGLDLGAKSPEEIALEIMAEIVKSKNRNSDKED
jgi:xanthine dehydrogenase accessory factor